MVPRSTLIAVLVGVEVAIIAGMVGAIRGSSPPPWFGMRASAGTFEHQAWTFAAGPAPAVEVDIGHADLTIETRPGPQITIAVASGVEIRSSGPISARDDGGTIHITAADRGRFSNFYADDRNVHVTVPPATRITVRRAGDIRATGLRAAATFDSPHGDIEIRDFRGSLAASSADGHVEVSDAVCTTLRLASQNGRVVLRHVDAAQIDASSNNGRVEGTALQLRDGVVSSANGRVSLGFVPVADTTVTAASNNGHVRVSGFATTLGNQTKRSNDDDDNDVSSTGTQVRIGAGSGRLNVHANNGNIDLIQEG